MTEEQKKALLEYEELKVLIKDAEERISVLKPIVLELVPEGKKINATAGYFELKKRDNWVFGPEIQAKEAELKTEKAGAIAKGEATNSPTFYVEYRSNVKKARTVVEEDL